MLDLATLLTSLDIKVTYLHNIGAGAKTQCNTA